MLSTRKRWAIVILLLAAGSSFWAARWLAGDRRAPSPPPAARSDYSLQTFDLLVMNGQGLPSFRVEAPYLEKSPHDESMSITEPRMWLFEAGDPSWKARADSGWIRADGEEIVLTGAVQLEQMSGDSLRVQTNELTFYPETRLAGSQAPVQLHRDGMRMDGLGLDADLKTRRFELLSQVRAHYDPK